MARRIHIPRLRLGDVLLDPAEAHHARDVLRLPTGAEVEVFDDAGASAKAVLLHVGPRETSVRITHIDPADASPPFQWIVASAIPKGERADWMVEKLSELGAAAFIPLATARSVVLPEGRNKLERWSRIATEAAKQSRRAGVMRIEELTPLDLAVQRARAPDSAVQRADGEAEVAPTRTAWFLATEVPGIPIAAAVSAAKGVKFLTLFIGPEGGWTETEAASLQSAGITAVRLGPTILRIETAAIAVGAIVASLLSR